VAAKDSVAEQLAVAPPFVPAHVHENELAPETTELVPAKQSPVVGTEENVPPFDVPHDPFTATGVAISVPIWKLGSMDTALLE
jgi:hypothetical protein